METIYILMNVLFLVFILAGFLCGIGFVLWELAKQITKGMSDDERYDG